MEGPRKTTSILNGDTEHFIIPLAIFAVGIGAYFVLRYSGNWMDVDTERLTQSAQAIVNEGTLLPSSDAYPFGFNYPTLTALVAQLSGQTVLDLQTKVFPMIGTLMVALVSFALFREVLGKGKVALVATLLLLLQGDLLFVTLRGSHEKLTWPLMMVALFLLYRSSAKPEKLSVFATYVGLFYLTIYALVATSAFFSSTLIAAITLSLVLGLAIDKWPFGKKAELRHSHFQRLSLVSASSIILLYLSVIYVYVPGRQVLNTLPTIVDRIAQLLLGFQLQVNPYKYVGIGWTSPTVYLVLSLLTWILLLGSLTEWLRQGVSLLRRRQLRLPQDLPWLLYTGFAVQVVGALALDLSGALSGNLELRILPGLMILAAVLVGQALQRLRQPILSNVWLRRLAPFAAAVLLLFFTSAALIKATNDPAFSNKWTFYSSGEKTAIEWSNSQLQDAEVSAGVDERLPVLFGALYGNAPTSGNAFESERYQAQTGYLLFSEIERSREARLGVAPPPLALENRIYDNGDTELYYKRP